MCGIFGFTGKKDSKYLQEMAKALFHRGPDDQGFYEDDRISLGQKRLSIIDLSPNGRQPMTNEDSTIWVTVNGEIYNYKGLRAELSSLGHLFRSSSDSEVAVHAYEEYGEEFPLKLEGMFALALWDSRKRKLILARDRIGIKPLYYTQTASRLIFASEIKAILRDASIKREVNEASFWCYLAFQCDITNETMFKGIYKLEPGSMLILENNELVIKRYWSLSEGRFEKTSEDQVATALVNAVSSHLVSDVPVGVLLSGGLDSSSIVAIMHEHGVKNIETFTVGFGQPDDEFKDAKLVAERFKTSHHELLIEAGDLKNLLNNMIWHMDEPIADGGAIATYLASKKVREFVKVVLVGEGGDETLGGYNWYKLASFPLSLLPQTVKKRIYFYFTTFYKSACPEPFNALSARFKPGKDFLNKMSFFEINNILPNSLLMKVDKMTMAHSLEARVPFLDHNFVRTALGLPANKRISAFSTKKFLRRYMSGRLPESIIKKKKHGFILPIDRWLKNELKEFAKDILLSKEACYRSYFSKNIGEDLFDEKKGLPAIENNSLIWKLLVFEIWHKEYIRNN